MGASSGFGIVATLDTSRPLDSGRQFYRFRYLSVRGGHSESIHLWNIIHTVMIRQENNGADNAFELEFQFDYCSCAAR